MKERFEELRAQTARDNPHWRQGQVAWVAFYQLDPQEATRIQNTELDPYHFGDRLEAFYEHLDRYFAQIP